MDFLDVDDSLSNLKRHREIPEEEAKSGTYYSKAYFDARGMLLRLDEIGSGTIPREVYIEYANDLPVWAVEFRLGIGIYGKRVSESPDLSNEWIYKYDETGRLAELIWHSFATRNFKYGYDHDESFHHRYYEYDAKGLLRIFQQNKENRFFHDKVITYDRARQQLLSRHTVSKTPWVPISKQRKRQVPLLFGGSPTNLGIEIPICRHCGQPLTLVCAVRLDPPLRNRSLLFTIPVLHCFNCLEWITSVTLKASIEDPQPGSGAYDAFPEVHLQLGRPTDSTQE